MAHAWVDIEGVGVCSLIGLYEYIFMSLLCRVKVQREALAESSVVFGRVFGNKMGRHLTVVENNLFSG